MFPIQHFLLFKQLQHLCNSDCDDDRLLWPESVFVSQLLEWKNNFQKIC